MAYSNNPNLPKARAITMKLLITDGLPSAVVANKCGVHRSTVWRWKQKWLKLNENIQQDKPGRPTRVTSFVPAYYRWSIKTEDPTPHSFPHAIAQHVVARILELRHTLKRCAEVIWHHITQKDGVSVSLSSVKRTLRRHHQYDGSRKKRVRPDNPRRPKATYPGELVQTDTIHYICPTTYRRRYVYTVIDLYSRFTYSEIHNNIRPSIAADVIMRAQAYGGFAFHMVQADNGPEFSRYFEQRMNKNSMQVRHSRLGRHRCSHYEG
jgi:transposase